MHDYKCLFITGRGVSVVRLSMMLSKQVKKEKEGRRCLDASLGSE